MASGTSRPRTARVLVVAVGVLAAANLLVLAAVSQDTSTSTAGRPPSVEVVFPAEGAVVRPQEVVGADLADGMQGILVINDVRVPEDQYEGDSALGQVFFRPGEGRQWEVLPEGAATATVEYWERTLTESEARAQQKVYTYTWRFTVG